MRFEAPTETPFSDNLSLMLARPLVSVMTPVPVGAFGPPGFLTDLGDLGEATVLEWTLPWQLGTKVVMATLV